MTSVTLGSTGITSPQNAFGCLPIQRVDSEYAGNLLRKAYEAGITFFDTANAYSDSEEKMGQALHDVRGHIHLATKTGAADADTFWRHLELSLKRLQTDYIDIYQFHNPAVCPKPGDGSGLYEAAVSAKEQGMIRHIGITNHRVAVAEEAILSGLFETLQFPFNYLSTEKEMALTELCRHHNMGFIAMKGLSGGLLSNAAAAFAWIQQQKDVLPIWGIQRERELDEFIGFMHNPPAMTEELRALIARDRQELVGSFCRACGYCMPCPQGIEINNCARMPQLIRRSPSAPYLTPAWQEKMARIESCLHCGHCASRCPYGLDTPALLARSLADYRDILAGKVTL